MKKVTIGVPIRNGMNHLKYSLPCFSQIDYPEEYLEFVFIDHGSTDQSIKLISEFSNNKKNVKIVSIPFEEANRSHVRNQILNNSNGDFLIFLDQDVLVPSSLVKSYLKVHEEIEDAVITGQVFCKNVEYGTTNLEEYIQNINDSYSKLEINNDFADFRVQFNLVDNKESYRSFNKKELPWRFFWTTNISIPRKFIELCPFDEGFKGWGVEDEEFGYQLFSKGANLIYSRDAWCIHNPHKINNISNDNSWHINMNYFFKKYENRAIEIYNYFLINAPKELSNIEFNINRISKEDLNKDFLMIKEFEKNSMAVICPNENINTTIILNPFLDEDSLPTRKKNKIIYSLFGLNLPFNDKNINCAYLSMASVSAISIPLCKLLLLEISRVSQKIIILDSQKTENISRIEGYLKLLDIEYQII